MHADDCRSVRFWRPDVPSVTGMLRVEHGDRTRTTYAEHVIVSILEHAGVGERVTIVHGTLGDGGKTAATLRDKHGFERGNLDSAFIDHAKEAYLPDIELILREGWLRRGALVVADNVKVPGAPEYHAFMKAKEGTLFRTREHSTHVEYQKLIKDIVLESEFVGDA